jgi:hypothetical protein
LAGANSIWSVLQFKDIFAAGASFDPLKCAPIVWKTISLVLEVKFPFFLPIEILT